MQNTENNTENTVSNENNLRAALCLDTPGSFRLTRDELREFGTPAGTRTHKPVNHGTAADLTVKYANLFGYSIDSEEFGVNPSKTQMFGVLRVTKRGEAGRPDMQKAIAIRNSHDKAFAFGMLAGVSVFCCSNLMFNAGKQSAAVRRKHTSGINLAETIPQLFRALESEYATLYGNIDRIKETKIESRAALCEQVVTMVENNVLPSCDIMPVIQQFENPLHEEFSLHTEYALFNCVNEVAKKYTAKKADKCYRGLSDHFGLSRPLEIVEHQHINLNA
jgi:hypothetical protein